MGHGDQRSSLLITSPPRAHNHPPPMSTPAIVRTPANAPELKLRVGGGRGDRCGVILSVVCAIHCAVTPLILLAAPAFGRVWSHPASHWLVAVFVVPLAVFMVTKGYRRHRRKWIVASGVFGIALVLAGAAAPSLARGAETFASVPTAPAEAPRAVDPGGCRDPDCATECAEEAGGAAASSSESCPDTACARCCAADAAAPESGSGSGDPRSTETATIGSGACVDACCPSIQAAEDGGWRLHIPLASVLTTLGGGFLIATHIGNLFRCPMC